MKITIYGAAKNVTGSMHLIEANGKRLLLECGIRQGRREESEEWNRNLPVDPASVDAMILSHAHLDHSGNIPTLVRSGYGGDIYMTPATLDLLGLMLRDSAHIQESDIAFVNKKRGRQGLPPKEPLYSLDDAERSLDHFASFAYERSFSPLPGIRAVFHEAGHILGSAMVDLEITEGDKKRRLLFSGDVGRPGLPIIKDPFRPTQADWVLLESTYGDRLHDDVSQTATKLEQVVKQVYQRQGKIIIPAFSVGRTQDIVYHLHLMFESGRLPAIPIYVDSPLSVNVTEVYKMHPECFDRETRQLLDDSGDPFGFGRLTYIRNTVESRRLNDKTGPCIIISASGMCEGGRVLHHLRNSIEDSRNMVLIVGFQAQGTLGRRLVDKFAEVRIFGELHQVKAEIKTLNGFSAHADRNDLLELADSVRAGAGRFILVHGEEAQSQSLARALRDRGREVTVPDSGQSVEL